MELVYSMRRRPLKCEPPHFECPTDTEIVRPICTISSANIIAFSSPTELSDADGDTWGGHVYVCDLDTPWDSHKVTSTAHPVSALEWDGEGKQLLVATTAGDVSVFGQKEFLLNEWTCLYTASFPGEHIIKAVFFHNGRRVVVVDKKPDAPIPDKFQMMRPTPTLKGFGGIACEGAAIVTATGLVGALTPPSAESPRALVATESLRATRDYITSATIAHKNGNLVIAGVCRLSAGWCVRAVACAVTRAPPAHAQPPAPPVLAIQPLPALYLPEAGGTPPPVSITWCLREDTDSLLIAGSTLTLWKLTERAHPVHKLLSKGPLQGSTTPGGGQKTPTDCFNTLVWQQTAIWPIEGGAHAVQVASNQLPLSPPYAILATTKALHLLSRDSHHYLCSRAVVTSGAGGGEAAPAGAGTPPKKAKYGPGLLPSGTSSAIVSHIATSLLGGACACVDSHAQLHVYRLPLYTEIPSPLAHTSHACQLLEYSMVWGLDCLDVLMALKPKLVEPVYERMTETFQRQPQSFQQYYYHSWLKLRIALCRAVPTLAHAASWLTCVQMCSAAWAAACVTLRPDDKPDNAPLSHLLDDGHDQEKTLLALEAKPESVGDVSCLGALRRVLQRALHVALTALLTRMPQHQMMHQHGYDITTDPHAVCLLRKLVLLARAGGAGSQLVTDTATHRYDITTDPHAVCLLRKLVLLARAGGAGSQLVTDTVTHRYDITTDPHAVCLLRKLVLLARAGGAGSQLVTDTVTHRYDITTDPHAVCLLRKLVLLARAGGAGSQLVTDTVTHRYDITTDPHAVCLLRKLVLLARAGGAGSQLVTDTVTHRYDITTDPHAVCLLRKLVLLARAGGAGSQLVTDTVTHRYDITTDPHAVCLLRKLVLLARASGRGGEALSRPLARLQSAPKLDLQEDYLTLSTQMNSARAWECPPRCSVHAPHGKPYPLVLEYDVEPEALRFAPDPAYTHCDSTPTLAMDSIRYMYLGGGWRPAKWRQCARCGARALPAAQPARHPAQRAHDARFLLACRCGGKWSLFSNIS